MNLTIGYFGIPGRTGGQTHIFDEEANKPLCGTPMHKDARYEWCFPTWKAGLPECERCRKKQTKMMTEEAARTRLPKPRTVYPKPRPHPGIRLLERIQNYLEVGGLFNPEMMEHDKVRDLIIDCRDYISKSMLTD